ncbi:MAG: nucleotidyltransferase family protein [Burkholderiaceae bacterium]|nr:nucleotidyltransferase family protein [Burkholderiaceae bacterium]
MRVVQHCLLIQGLAAVSCPAWTDEAWEQALAQARATRLLGRLACQAQDHHWLEDVPPGPRMQLRGVLRLVHQRQQTVRWEANRLAAALSDIPGPVVLLKGSAYVLADLPPARGRLFSDVDIMVARSQLSSAEGSLMAGGWIPEKLDAYDDRYYRDWMHELPPLRHVQRGSQLDVHHTITPPTSRFPVDGSQLLADAQPLPAEPGLHVLAPVDMVLHSAVHLMQEGNFDGALRDLYDISDLIQHFAGQDPMAFWQRLASRAQVLGLARPMAHVVRQLGRLFELQPPSSQRDTWQAMLTSTVGAWLMCHLMDSAVQPRVPHTPGWRRDGETRESIKTRCVGLALYVRSHWLRMPWFQIFPHLLRKGWMRAAASRRDARARAALQATVVAGGAVEQRPPQDGN